MAEPAGLDVRLGLYDHALFRVDYYINGHMGVADVPAVITFREDYGYQPIPMAIYPVEQQGGFLRGRRTVFQVTAGGDTVPQGQHNSLADAQIDSQQRALSVGAGIFMGMPELVALAKQSYPFEPGTLLFSSRYYCGPINKEKTLVLNTVTHFSLTERPSVPFVVLAVERNGRTIYAPGFSEDGDKIEYLGLCANQDDAFHHVTQIVVGISSALMGIASAQSHEKMMSAFGMSGHVVPGGMSLQQMQQQYQGAIQQFRRGIPQG